MISQRRRLRVCSRHCGTGPDFLTKCFIQQHEAANQLDCVFVSRSRKKILLSLAVSPLTANAGRPAFQGLQFLGQSNLCDIYYDKGKL